MHAVKRTPACPPPSRIRHTRGAVRDARRIRAASLATVAASLLVLAASCSDDAPSHDATAADGAGATGSPSGSGGAGASGGSGGGGIEALSIDPLAPLTLSEETEVSFAVPVHGSPDRVFADD